MGVNNKINENGVASSGKSGPPRNDDNTTSEMRRLDNLITSWEHVKAEYGRSAEAGIAAYQCLTQNCPLCEEYKNHDIECDPEGLAAVLKCRPCPIVKATRRVCVAHWRDSGIDDYWYLTEDAPRVADSIIAFLINVRSVFVGDGEPTVDSNEFGVATSAKTASSQ